MLRELGRRVSSGSDERESAPSERVGEVHHRHRLSHIVAFRDRVCLQPVRSEVTPIHDQIASRVAGFSSADFSTYSRDPIIDGILLFPPSYL